MGMGICSPHRLTPSLHPKKHFLMTANKPVKEVTKILIVEDEGDMSLLLELLLDGENMQLEHAHNLTDARDLVEKEQPNLIVLDNRLPDGYGIDFVSYLKKQFPLIKVIMMSGIDAAAMFPQMPPWQQGPTIFYASPLRVSSCTHR